MQLDTRDFSDPLEPDKLPTDEYDDLVVIVVRAQRKSSRLVFAVRADRLAHLAEAVDVSNDYGSPA